MKRSQNWTETYTRLSKVDRVQSLVPEDLEILATSAYLTGREEECIDAMKRAQAVYLSQNLIHKAVRCIFWLGFIHLNKGDKAHGSGWITKGKRLLDKEDQKSAEYGLLLIPLARGALSGGNVAKAMKLFEQAVSIGEQCNDADLKAIALFGYGLAMVRQGNVNKGISLLDEAMIVVESEEVHHIARGIVYCGALSICRKVWDLQRAKEWTTALSKWCNSQPDLVPFRGQCLVRRAEILQRFGDWTEAMKEAELACIRFRTSLPSATGEAYYLQAELHRLFGAFENAESCYKKAAKWGRNPQPGLALLRLVQGRIDVAETSIRNNLRELKDPMVRADLLPGVVRIMIAAGQNREAREATEELNEIAFDFDVPYLYAMSSYALGTVLFAEKDFTQALEHLEKALKIWISMDLPYETARTREVKGLIYRKMGDKESSDMEFVGTKWTYEQLMAKPDLQRIERLENKRKNRDVYGLTLRELQILRHVTYGRTNKSVASELFISERTVDRHMSNIFNKLKVNSRVKATAFAIKHGIFE